MMRTTRLLAIFAVLASSVTNAYGKPEFVDSKAPKAEKKPSKLSAILGSMDWGASKDATLGHIGDGLGKRYEAQLANADPLQIDTILSRKAKELDTVKASLVRFDGQRTGYETSFVNTEVLPRNNESLMKVDDLVAQRYFFFRDDGLWKVVVVYNSSSSDSFAGFVSQIRKKYGKPKKVEWTKVDGQRAMGRAQWEDHQTRIVAEDMSAFYSAFVMRFIEVGNGTTWQDRRAHLRKEQTQETNARADGLLADIMGGDGEPSGDDSDVVDQLTGVEHSVDTSIDEEEAQPKLRRENTKSKAKAKPKRTQRKAKKSTIDRRQAPTNTDTYIIY